MGYSPVKHTLVRYFPRIFALIPRKRLAMFPLALPLLENKAGLEIGGPSPLFRRWNQPLPIYDRVGTLDNCDFAWDTTWASTPQTICIVRERSPARHFSPRVLIYPRSLKAATTLYYPEITLSTWPTPSGH